MRFNALSFITPASRSLLTEYKDRRVTQGNMTYNYLPINLISQSARFNTLSFRFNLGNCDIFYPRLFYLSIAYSSHFSDYQTILNVVHRQSRRSYVESPTSFTMLYRTIPCYREHYVRPHPVNRGRNASQVVILLCLRRGRRETTAGLG